MRRMLFIFFLLSLLVLIPAYAQSDVDMEQEFVELINEERVDRGLSSLPVSEHLAKVARDHSQDMANEGQLYHNPDLGEQVSSWRRVGENVGTGTSVSGIHAALMNSEKHRENILDSGWDDVGVGVVVDSDDKIWVTQVYREQREEETEVDSRSGRYTDDHLISDAHKAAVYELKNRGIMVGKRDGSFGPKDNLTREQSASLVYRLLEELEN